MRAISSSLAFLTSTKFGFAVVDCCVCFPFVGNCCCGSVSGDGGYVYVVCCGVGGFAVILDVRVFIIGVFSVFFEV